MSNYKKIIGIVIIVFVVLIGYKFISSSIQENKEKAVLQERYNLEQLQKDQENKQKILEKQQKSDYIESCTEEARYRLRIALGSKCFDEVGDEAILSCAKKEINERCKKYENNIDLNIECLKGQLAREEKISENFRLDKNECYLHYK